MTRTLTKVIYKPDSQSTEEYTVIVNPAEYKKWKAGERSLWQKLLTRSLSFIRHKEAKAS
ncbi:hypothetical protein H1R20_g9206, partial [Candolleomyces eurysporus]